MDMNGMSPEFLIRLLLPDNGYDANWFRDAPEAASD